MAAVPAMGWQLVVPQPLPCPCPWAQHRPYACPSWPSKAVWLATAARAACPHGRQAEACVCMSQTGNVCTSRVVRRTSVNTGPVRAGSLLRSSSSSSMGSVAAKGKVIGWCLEVSFGGHCWRQTRPVQRCQLKHNKAVLLSYCT